MKLICCLHLRLKEHLAPSCPVESLVLSFSGKGHMRGVPSMGLEIESWHLLSTWIPCQASCICGFIYMPSTLFLKAPALADPSAWNLLPPDLHMASPSLPSGLCSNAGPAIAPAPRTALSSHPALCFSLAWIPCAMPCV